MQISWEHHDIIDSTNNRAKEILRTGELPVPFAVTAESQTAGRGRGNRQWWTGTGAIAVSLGLESSRSETALLSLLAAVVIAEKIERVLQNAKIGIHWPNDVQIDGAKVAGILTESPSVNRAVLGFGINVNNSSLGAPEEFKLQPITSIRDVLGEEIDRKAFLDGILDDFFTAFSQLRATPQLAVPELIAKIRRLCVQIGRETSVRRGDELISGVCAGISDNGSIILETPEGLVTLF